MNDFVVTIDSEKFVVNANHSEHFNLNGNIHNVEIIKLSDHTYKVELDNNVYHITTNKLATNSFRFLVNGHYFESLVRTRLEERAANLLNNKSTEAGTTKIKSPMPGLILRIDKNIGDTVEEGESIILLEAMKMENEIRSPSSGIVKEIFISEGSSVDKNQSLLYISKL